MTQDKKLKRQIRERAARKGESYASARRQVLAARAVQKAPPLPKSAVQATQKAGSAGAVSDTKVIEKTGHGLAHWYGVLDSFDAAKKGHTLAARHLRDDHKLTAWYSQGITVAYERARGLRSVNQASKGYQVSVSRVLPTTFDKSLNAVSQAAQRKRWIGDSGGALAEGLDGKRRFKRDAEKAMLRWRAEEGLTEVSIVATDDGRSRIVVTCSQMPDHEFVESKRIVWKKLLDALRTHLGK